MKQIIMKIKFQNQVRQAFKIISQKSQYKINILRITTANKKMKIIAWMIKMNYYLIKIKKSKKDH